MRFIALIVIAGVLVGCAEKKTPIGPSRLGIATQENRQHITTTDASGDPVIPAGADNPNANPDSLTDVCAARLHDVEGAMLLYYVKNKKMPETLDDLKEGYGADLALSCARTGESFRYFGGGLAAPDKKQRIVAWDPTPMGARKFRWCLVVSPSKPGSIVTDVIPIAENIFNTYKPVND